MTRPRVVIVILLAGIVVVAAIVFLAPTRRDGRIWTVTIRSPDGRATSQVTFLDRDGWDSTEKHVSEAIRRHCDRYGSNPDASSRVVCTADIQGVSVETVEIGAPLDFSGSRDATLTETITISGLGIRLRPDGKYELCRLEGETVRFVAGAEKSLTDAADALAERLVERARGAASASDAASALP